MAETEDIPYSVSDFATPEEEEQSDEDKPNKSVLVDILEYLDEQIKKHNSLDVIKPDAENTMTTQQQVLVHQAVVGHLRNVRTTINNKVKELP